MSSLLFNDLTYLGIKGCFYLTKFVGIAGYNAVAYVGGYQRMDFFTPTTEQLLLMEVKNLKNELSEMKTIMKGQLLIRQTPEYIYIDQKEDSYPNHLLETIEPIPSKKPLLLEYHNED